MDTLTFILFILGFVLLIGGAELLVRGASRLAIAVGISPLVVGLTVVAYGTSAPELAVSVQSSLAGVTDIAVGNIVGSNIANVLLILGMSATIVPLAVSQQLVRLDVPLMIVLAVVMLLMGLDGQIDRFDGLLLAAGGIGYTVFAIYQSRKETQEVKDTYTQEFQPAKKPTGLSQSAFQVGLIVAGLALLVTGANWLVDGAVAVARMFGISELIIGLTIVAVGTSLPEIATSTVASLRGERDIAVGNIVGSNIFNILIVLGVTSAVTPGGIPVSPAAIHFDIPVMIGVSLACLPIFFTGLVIARWEGLLFLGYYVAYTLYLILNTTQHDSLDTFTSAMLFFVLPLTALTLIISTARAIREGQHLKLV